MHNTRKKIFLAAAIGIFSATAMFPAFGEELVGTGVIVVDDTEAVSPDTKAEGPAPDGQVENKAPDVKEADSDSEPKKEELVEDTEKKDSRKNSESSSTASAADSEQETVSSSSGQAQANDSKHTQADDANYVNAGPGAVKKQEKVPEPKEVSLGTFTITGYCGCDICTGTHTLTYSGTVPKPNHTLSADLSKFPLGTKLRINGIVYTVEDMGSAVTGDVLDIFYATHEEALARGTYTAEVFSVED